MLGLVFGVATVAGGAIGPDREGAEEPAGGMEGEHGEMASADAIRGLAVADDGLRLELATTSVPRGEATALRFRIAGAKPGDFEVTHTSGCT